MRKSALQKLIQKAMIHEIVKAMTIRQENAPHIGLQSGVSLQAGIPIDHAAAAGKFDQANFRHHAFDRSSEKRLSQPQGAGQAINEIHNVVIQMRIAHGDGALFELVQRIQIAKKVLPIAQIVSTIVQIPGWAALQNLPNLLRTNFAQRSENRDFDIIKATAQIVQSVQ